MTEKNCNECRFFAHDLEDAFCVNPVVAAWAKSRNFGFCGQVGFMSATGAKSPCGPEKIQYEPREPRAETRAGLYDKIDTELIRVREAFEALRAEPDSMKAVDLAITFEIRMSNVTRYLQRSYGV